MEEWCKMRNVETIYPEREDDRQVNTEQAFNPPNADKIVISTNGILQELGEGESILEQKDGLVTRYTKLNGKLYQEDTTLTEV